MSAAGEAIGRAEARRARRRAIAGGRHAVIRMAKRAKEAEA